MARIGVKRSSQIVPLDVAVGRLQTLPHGVEK
jgi:hypothetical protein